MINFDSLSLKALVEEITPLLLDGRVQKVQQPSKNELLIGIRSIGKSFKLYISVDPKYPHISILTAAGEKYRDIQIPSKPPMFCMLLRKHMEGTKILKIRQPEYERILEIYFESYNELGVRIPMVLACEIMGKYSNIVLYNYENNVILGCSHPVSSEKSRERELAGGLPYIYPPKLNKQDLTLMTKDQFLQMAGTIPDTVNSWLNRSFYHISLALATELCEYCDIPLEKNKIVAIHKEKLVSLYDSLVILLDKEKFAPSISEDKKIFSLAAKKPFTKWKLLDSTNDMIDNYFGYQIFKDNFSRLKTSLTSLVNKELKKLASKENNHNKKVEEESKAEKYKEIADILMANLNNVPVGVDVIELENFYNNYKLEKINLDPAKSVTANAQKYYKLYNKGKQAAKISLEILEEINLNMEYLKGLIVSIEHSDNMADLKDIKEELIAQKLMKSDDSTYPSKGKSKKDNVDIKEIESSDGIKIFVGKNNRQNEYILSKISSPNDIWLHTHNIPGSHVLIKQPQGEKTVPDQTLLEAANIAAYYSQAKNSLKIPVIYTLRRFLKKPPASKPGYVIYSNEKTLFITPDENMIRNLTLVD